MELLQVLEYTFLFILGAALGSFYNVVIYRLPRNISIISPSSHCPNCGKKIKWYDNIPIISYFLLKGKCRYCGHSISIRYPLVEAFTGILAVLCRSFFNDLFLSLLYFAFFSILLIASLIDWDTFTLPDIFTLGGLLIALAVSPFREDISLRESILGTLIGGGIFLLIYLYYTKLRKIEGLGFGDVKLMAFIGCAFGVWGVIYAIFLGSLFGLLYAIPLIVKNRNLQFALPYGPFLSLGAFIGILLNLKEWFF